jgi:hypothetical protein
VQEYKQGWSSFSGGVVGFGRAGEGAMLRRAKVELGIDS